METISRDGRAVRGFALGHAGYGALSADPNASVVADAPSTVLCSPSFLTTVMTGAAVGMFAGYALQAPRWAAITAGIGAAMFLVPVRVVAQPQQRT